MTKGATSPIRSSSEWTPAWRLGRAQQLLRRQERPRRHDDAWVRLALSFLRWREGGGRRRPARCADIAGALALYATNELVRWHAEARLLAGEDVATVAVRCALPIGVIEAYAAVCFAIPPAARDLIATRVLPRRACLGVDPSDTAGLLKLMAYKGGPLVLDQTLMVLTGSRIGPDDVPALDLDGLRAACGELLCRVGLLLHVLPPASFSPGRVEVFEGLLDDLDDLRADLGAAPASPYARGHDRLLGAMFGMKGEASTPRREANDLPALAARVAGLVRAVEQAEAWGRAA